MAWIGTYSAGTPGLGAGDNGRIRLDLDNEPQPDLFVMIEPESGGQARISADDYVENAPELVGEVAASSVSYDLGKKLHVYRRNGVREYIAWRVQDREVDWFVLREGGYEPLAPGADGLLRSEAFPGLWLDRAALLRGDLATVLAVVHQGLASPEHAGFVARLQGACGRPTRRPFRRRPRRPGRRRPADDVAPRQPNAATIAAATVTNCHPGRTVL